MRVTLPTSAKHALLIDMAMRRAPTSSRLVMLETIQRQLDVYGSMTSGQLGLCQATIAGSS